MAGILRTPAFRPGVSAAERLNAGHARFIFALAVSVALHVWVVRGTAIEAPSRSKGAPAGVLTVYLEQTAAPAASVPRMESAPEPTSQLENAVRAEPLDSVPVRLERRRVRRSREANGNEVYPELSRGARDELRGVASNPISVRPERSGVAAESTDEVTPPISDPTYYPARELDVYPMPLARLRFEYPDVAARDQVSGKVQVMLLINEAGVTDDVSIVSAEPAGYFEDAAREVFKGVRFSPARKDGRAVKSRVLINVEFDPRSMAETPR